MYVNGYSMQLVCWIGSASNRAYAADVTVECFSPSHEWLKVVGFTVILETRPVVKIACLVPQPLLSNNY